MGLTHVTVKVRNLNAANGSYEARVLVDTGKTDSLVPAVELKRIGMAPVGKMDYELADGTIKSIRSAWLRFPLWARLPPDV